MDAKVARTKRHFSVVEVVAADPDPRISSCAKVYLSPFWDLITPPAPTPNELEMVINESFRKLNLFRVRDEEVPAGKRFAEDPAPFDWTMHDTYATNLHAIADRGDFDCLTLLCALYYEALLHNASFQLDIIHREIRWCVMRCEFWYSLKKEAQLLLEWLCNNRIVCSRWDPLPDPERRAMAHLIVNQQRAQFGLGPANEKNFEIDRMALRLYNSTAHHRYPVVPVTDELIHTRENLAKLNQQIDDEDWFPDSFNLPDEV